MEGEDKRLFCRRRRRLAPAGAPTQSPLSSFTPRAFAVISQSGVGDLKSAKKNHLALSPPASRPFSIWDLFRPVSLGMLGSPVGAGNLPPLPRDRSPNPSGGRRRLVVAGHQCRFSIRSEDAAYRSGAFGVRQGRETRSPTSAPWDFALASCSRVALGWNSSTPTYF